MSDPALPPLNGFLVVNKPRGPSSASVTNHLKWMLKQQGYPKNIKIGHGGTLDPLAEGVLPVGIGKATKQLQQLLDGPKTYLFTVKFGTQTTTGDAEGEVTGTVAVPCLTIAAIRRASAAFVGCISQSPPPFSALKINGLRAYKLAREGHEIVLPPRQITIHAIECIDYNERETEATFSATVGKGTYIRTLAEDISKSLETLGYVTLLRRTQHGPFTLESAITPEILDNAIKTGQIAAHILPLLAVPPAGK